MYTTLTRSAIGLSLLSIFACGDNATTPHQTGGGGEGSATTTSSSTGTGAPEQGGGGAGGEALQKDLSWLDQDWPTTLDDPAGAAESVFALDGRFTLDLEPGDVTCQALDCPGGEDGWDPSGEGQWDVFSYSFVVDPLPKNYWRAVRIQKAITEDGEVGIWYGSWFDFSRRRSDGGLVALVPMEYDNGVSGQDYAEVGFSEDASGARFSVSYDGELVARGVIELGTDHVVVDTPAMTFRAPHAEPTTEDPAPPSPFEQLTLAAEEADLLALLAQAKETVTGLDPLALARVVARAYPLLDHPSEAVRVATIDYLSAAFGLGADPFLTNWDHVAYALQMDASPSVRLRAAQALYETTAWSELYHCLVAETVETCVVEEPAEPVRSACQETIDLHLDVLGSCPWQR